MPFRKRANRALSLDCGINEIASQLPARSDGPDRGHLPPPKDRSSNSRRARCGLGIVPDLGALFARTLSELVGEVLVRRDHGLARKSDRRLDDDVSVEKQPPVLDVKEIVCELAFVAGVGAVNLRPTCKARPHERALDVEIRNLQVVRTRTNKREFTA